MYSLEYHLLLFHHVFQVLDLFQRWKTIILEVTLINLMFGFVDVLLIDLYHFSLI